MSVSLLRRIVQNHWFVCSFSQVSGSGESWNARCQSDLAPPTFSNDREKVINQHNITTKFLSAEERFVVQNRDVVAQASPSLPKLNTVTSRVWENE